MLAFRQAAAAQEHKPRAGRARQKVGDPEPDKSETPGNKVYAQVAHQSGRRHTIVYMHLLERLRPAVSPSIRDYGLRPRRTEIICQGLPQPSQVTIHGQVDGARANIRVLHPDHLAWAQHHGILGADAFTPVDFVDVTGEHR